MKHLILLWVVAHISFVVIAQEPKRLTRKLNKTSRQVSKFYKNSECFDDGNDSLLVLNVFSFRYNGVWDEDSIRENFLNEIYLSFNNEKAYLNFSLVGDSSGAVQAIVENSNVLCSDTLDWYELEYLKCRELGIKYLLRSNIGDIATFFGVVQNEVWVLISEKDELVVMPLMEYTPYNPFYLKND